MQTQWLVGGHGALGPRPGGPQNQSIVPTARLVARRGWLLITATLLIILALSSWAPAAFAHAQLLGTSPESGATAAIQPREVIFKFNQAVGGTLGAVRVYDAEGREVDNLDVSHPAGQEHWMGVGLKPHLPDGTYTATYRVISADTHIVYGGLVFNIGHAGAAPKFTVAGLIGRNQTGAVTKLAFGVVRSLDYLTIALMLGGLAFLGFAWRPALAAMGGSDADRQAARAGFGRRLRRVLLGAIAVGLAVSVLGFLLQGASAAGVSLWASLRGSILHDTLHSRFGAVWGARALDWVLIAGLLGAAKRSGRGLLSGPLPSRWLLGLLGLSVIYLAITPALAGHASIESPVAVFFPSDVLHVLAASIWVGGVASLLLVMPAATRRLPGPDRSRLLLAVLVRFSPLALGAVIVIAATGVVQAYIDVRSLHGLFHTTYGVLVLVKVALLLLLIGLGAINRQRMIPALERIAEQGSEPGSVGVSTRRTLRGELVALLAVFGVTAALIGYAPPIDAASGPFSANAKLGPAELELTVEPARVGLNTIHLYLIDAKTGAQFTATKELTATARLPSKGIGPLPLKANLAGPGHYVFSSAVLSPGGSWELEITDRVSEFEQFSHTVKVPVQ
jgi:copper transport protein